MDLEVLRIANERRTEQEFHRIMDWSPTDWATAFGGEVGEALNKIKKLRRGENIATEDIGDELADSLIYMDLLANRLGINLSEAVIRKFNRKSEEIGSDIRLLDEDLGTVGYRVRGP